MKNIHKQSVSRSIIIMLLLFFSQNVYSQQNRSNFYISPMISVGYAFNSGYTYGFDITLGVLKIQDNIHPTNLAVATKFYFFNLQGTTNRVLSFNLVVENDYTRIGFGLAEVKRKWGFKSRNIHRAFGPTTEFGVHFGNEYLPWIGFKTMTPLITADWFERKSIADFNLYYRNKNIDLQK